MITSLMYHGYLCQIKFVETLSQYCGIIAETTFPSIQADSEEELKRQFFAFINALVDDEEDK